MDHFIPWLSNPPEEVGSLVVLKEGGVTEERPKVSLFVMTFKQEEWPKLQPG